MARRQREWAKRARARLKAELGGVCFRCGNADFESLQFHHTEPRTWKNQHVEQSMRIRRLREEARAGLIRLACPDCNIALGEPEPPPEPDGIETPF